MRITKREFTYEKKGKCKKKENEGKMENIFFTNEPIIHPTEIETLDKSEIYYYYARMQ